jgi:selenium-dependent xanthine dehydrogenase
MITFKLNNKAVEFEGDGELTLLQYLRNDQNIISAKDGCSGQAACGACMVEIDGKPKLSCVIKMKKLENANVLTLEGIPDRVRDMLAKAFIAEGAIQCGFCTPGFLMRTKMLLEENPNPTKEEIKKALNKNLCRCTGFVKIIDAIELAANTLAEGNDIELKKGGKIGERLPKYDSYDTAIGKRPFTDDLKIDGMLYSALKYSDHPKAIVKKIDTSEAEKVKGVVRIFKAEDIPGEQYIGLIFNDWPMMIKEGMTTNYIGDVLAGVVADTEETAREAVSKIKVEYDVLTPVTSVFDAIKDEIKVRENQSNVLETVQFIQGDITEAKKKTKYSVQGSYETQRIEHAFLEKEAAIARPGTETRIELLCQSQGVYEDRRQVARMLGLTEDDVRVTLIPNGGGFGGKEDMTVQGHVSLFAYHLNKPVKLSLTREESIRMHPKRHPVFMDIEMGADEKGMITYVTLKALGDTGAYASVGTKVMERVAGHCTGGYYVPNVDLEAKTIYTNNIPCGAMRGFGANQVSFALEGCIDEICEQGGFDRWKFRYDNALQDGLRTATGQKLEGVGIRACLDKLKPHYDKAKTSGVACAIKNSGIGNGMPDFSDVKVEIHSDKHVTVHHGWTEMGQGVHNMALQTVVEETGIDPAIIEVIVDTKSQIKTGMTTSSRGTVLVGNAIIDACKQLKEDLKDKPLQELAGRTYKGYWVCDWTTKPGADVEEPVTHYSYGYAAQLVTIDDNGEIDTVYAAHDAGKIMNPTLFEGQIEGAVHMGVGYALTEDLPMKEGFLVSDKLRDLKILKATETPNIVVEGIEVIDPHGPYGAKGVGEIGLVPTAAAVANALCKYDGVRRYKLPMKRK